MGTNPMLSIRPETIRLASASSPATKMAPAVLSRHEGSGLQVGEPQRVEGFHKARTWKKSGYFFARGAVPQVYHLPEGRVGVHGVYDCLAFE